MPFAHLTLATRDVARTAAFFENALRWPRIGVPANAPADLDAAWVEIGPGGQQIHILRIEGFEPSPFENEFGRHFAVFHPHADFAALKRRLVEHGATLEDPIRPTPFERFFFRAFNGYVFEVIAQEQYVRE
jgi:catechol 2,3-dioxygenase-like lactoylglutathione lyase family enzyme